jgi:hypothetical protein
MGAQEGALGWYRRFGRAAGQRQYQQPYQEQFGKRFDIFIIWRFDDASGLLTVYGGSFVR